MQSLKCNTLRKQTGTIMMTDEFNKLSEAVIGFTPNIFEVVKHTEIVSPVGDYWVISTRICSIGNKNCWEV